MKKLINLTIASLLFVTPASMSQSPQEFLINFGKTHCGNCGWFVVLDQVMGGRSTGEVSETDNSIIFQGKVSLENNGGFASIRTPYDNYDLSKFTHLEIRYKASGQSFAFTLNKYRRFFMPRFKHALDNTEWGWEVANIELREFKRYRLGEALSGQPSSSDLAKIIRLGMISNDKFASEYQLEIDFIRFY